MEGMPTLMPVACTSASPTTAAVPETLCSYAADANSNHPNTSHSLSEASTVGTTVAKARGAQPTSVSGGTKALKRAQKVAGSTHTHRHGSSSGGNGSGNGAGSHSASERCKAARTLAAELMSALMERPPQPAQIAQYRQFMRTAASSKPATSNTPIAASTQDKAVSVQHLAESGGATASDGGVSPVPAAATAFSSLSHSFLEAVRNGRARPSHVTSAAAAAAASSPAVTAKSATTSPPLSVRSSRGGSPVHAPTAAGPSTSHSGGFRRRSGSPNLSLPPPAAMSEGPGRRPPLELIPEDAATIPRLLGVLREIALSCATLDTLGGRLVSPPSSAQSMPCSSSSNGGAQSPSAAAMSAPLPPSRQASIAVSLQSATEATTLPSTAAPAGSMPKLYQVETLYYEEQWQRVRDHLQKVRELVLNKHEFASTLDAALGPEWRTTSSAAAPAVELAEAQHDSDVPTTDEEKGEVDLLHAVVIAETVPVSAVVPVMPTPVDHDGPTQLTGKIVAATRAEGEKGGSTAAGRGSGSVSASAAATATPRQTNSGQGNATGAFTITATAATTTSTTLNHNARPFHSRTPPSFQPVVGTQGGAAAAAAVPSYNGHRSNTATHNTNTASSMKQLSESSSTYSPSQHVTTFLERTTPPASGRLVEDGDGGLPNFPSTPLSEAAAPYQPSVSLMGGTSPRGNASTPSSTPFHLESREEMLRRRSAAPNAFYASMTHSGAAHFLGGPPSAATTPVTFVPSSVPPGSPSFALPGSGARSMPVSPLLSYGSPVTATQCPYDYILVLDFEATCEEHPPPNYLYEIIEFPVVVVDVRLQRVVAEFHRFVRPRHKVELSYFCQELTGMRQADVDAAAPLEEVVLQFERWFAHTVPPHARCVFATDGPTDMREFMYHHSVSRQGIRFPPLFYQYIDVKQTFACFFQCAQGKIKAMLEVLHIPFEGRLHSGLDDARNIASIVIGLLQYGCSFCEVPLNRLPLNGLLLSSGTTAASGGVSTPLSLPPSSTAAGSGRTRGSGASQTYITAPFSVDEDEYSY
jgi:3'-5' exoribonuclease 1